MAEKKEEKKELGPLNINRLTWVIAAISAVVIFFMSLFSDPLNTILILVWIAILGFVGCVVVGLVGYLIWQVMNGIEAGKKGWEWLHTNPEPKKKEVKK
uniref:Uncharacterized protein n=1 Tax=candidate division CPR3 bacterium TaxID=2268181 RepID=A0A7C4M0Q2_UNCC3